MIMTPEVRSWPLRELVIGELDDQCDDDAQQDDPNESTSAFEREVDAMSGTREVAEATERGWLARSKGFR
jgi:hypothetical protein